MNGLEKWIPALGWAREYKAATFSNDAVAAIIVTIMLIPQSLAYAMLAGLPPYIGLYASILPLIAYCIFGTSRTLAVGPVAVISLMTAAAAAKIAEPGSPLCLSETDIVARMAHATVGSERVDWLALRDDYGRIRDLIEQTIAGFTDFNARIQQRTAQVAVAVAVLVAVTIAAVASSGAGSTSAALLVLVHHSKVQFCCSGVTGIIAARMGGRV